MVLKVLLFGIRLWTNTVLLFQESLVENDFNVLFSVCIAKASRTIFKVLFVENDFKVFVGSLCQHLCACVRSFKFWPRLGRPPSSLCCELVSSIISWQDAAGHDSASEEQCVFCRRWFQVWRSWWSGKRIGTNESDINAMVSSGLDFSGTTEMMLDTTWTFKNKMVVERQPDSRKCLTCFIRDDMMCPLATALEGVRRYVPWGQTHTDGTSLTPRCGFCFKHFNSVVRYSRVPPVKLEEYEAQLGASEKLLELHVARITMLIHECIKRGRMDFRVNWEGIEKKALRVVQRKSMIKQNTRV